MAIALKMLATIALEFVDWQKREKVNNIIDRIRTKVSNFPGMIIEIDVEKKALEVVKTFN